MNMGRSVSFGYCCVRFQVDSSCGGTKREWSSLKRGHFERVGGTVGEFVYSLV